jgi:hypothetical protein
MKNDMCEFDLDLRWVPGMCNIADFWTRLGTKQVASLVATQLLMVGGVGCDRNEGLSV